MRLQVRKGKLVFEVENSKSMRKTTGPVKENIGLSNLRRQLDLLFAEYNLEIVNTEASFRVILSINLDSYGKV